MVFLLYLVAFALIVVALYIGSHCRPMRKENHVRRHVWSGSEMTVFLGLCILTAAIAFGPPSVLTVFRPRYVVPSFLLIALGVGAIFVWSMSRQGAAVTRLAGVALALLVVANVIRTDALQERQLGAAKLTHEAAKKLIAKEKHRWGERSQIALLTTRPQRTPTGGSVQRSNWYLRHLADHEIEVGLVGRVDMLGSDPFVKSSLKLSDLKMTGLREDLSLYLYEADKSGRRFLPRDVLFLGNDPAQMKFARFGAAPAKLAPADLSWGSCKEKKRDIFVWPTAPDVLAKHGAKPCVRK